MKKVRAISATTNKETHDGSYFSETAIDSMARTAEGVPVNIDFNPSAVVGKVSVGENVDGKLIVTAIIDNIPEMMKDKELFMVPGVQLVGNIKDKMIDDCILTQVGLTEKPSDPTVTPIEEID